MKITFLQKQQAAQSRQGYHGSHRPQGPVTPKLSWAYHNYTSMTHFLRWCKHEHENNCLANITIGLDILKVAYPVKLLKH